MSDMALEQCALFAIFVNYDHRSVVHAGENLGVESTGSNITSNDS